MDLKELTAGTPATKPWLTIVAKSVAVQTAAIDELTADTFEVNEIHANLISLADTASVPNPPAGTVSFYSSGTDLKSMDPLGNESTFLTSTNCHDFASVEDLEAAQQQINPLAPAGARDLWQRGDTTLTPAGPQLVHLPELDIILSVPLASGALYYSANGGQTFLPCVFDVAPTDFVIPGWNGVIVTTLGYAGTDPCYTSVDGINFTARAVPPAGIWSWSINWFAGRFVTGCETGGVKSIMTSENGITWTVRSIPGAMTDPAGLWQNSDVIVAAGGTGGIYSTDGITWALTTGDALIAHSGAWSGSQHLFCASGLSTTSYTSADGIFWDAHLASAPAGGPISMLWVEKYDKFYIPQRSTSEGDNYCLWYVTDPTQPFMQTQLDGADNDLMAYSTVIYDASRDRFIIGLYDGADNIAYSTPRPYAIKSASDDIRVRGSPVSVSQYANTQSVLVVNTAVETTIAPTVNSIGSLSLQSSQPVGSVVDFMMFLSVVSVAGDTLTLKIKGGLTGTNVLFSDVLTIAASGVAQAICIRGSISIRAATAVVNAFIAKGTTSRVSLQSGAYAPAITNALTVTAKWGLAASSCDMQSLVMTTHFRGGA